VLCKINDEICYRTGDLARLNPAKRLLEYHGRRDYQVKLRGQRIELGEIESVIMEVASLCIVVKTTHLDNEYLVAYVETKRNEHDVRDHCSSRLPLYMVPSFVVILDKVPLNQNGKIDRKMLPKVDFDDISVASNEANESLTEMERTVLDIWCQVLPHLKSIRKASTSFFSVGGNSLSLMRVHQLYKKKLKLKDVKIIDLFRAPTIAKHADLLLELSEYNVGVNKQWFPLNAMDGRLFQFDYVFPIKLTVSVKLRLFQIL
jgi:hypothetical protein